jgi:hypothetical protein
MTNSESAMTFDWLTFSNPVVIWWTFMLIVSILNIALWLALRHFVRLKSFIRDRGKYRVDLMILLCGAYVFGCAFRAVLPRADVQRISLFDTWLSSVFIGRSVATIAEVCFVIQWAIVLHHLANAIVPLILIAECFSWYAVVSTNYLGHAIENSIWALAFFLIAIALLPLRRKFHGAVQIAMGTAIAGIAGYLAFLLTIDVPMYFNRWQADVASGKALLDLLTGLYDVSMRRVVTHDFAHWRDEIAWMTLYFTLAVWSSLVLGGFSLVKDRLPRYQRFNTRELALAIN